MRLSKREGIDEIVSCPPRLTEAAGSLARARKLSADYCLSTAVSLVRPRFLLSRAAFFTHSFNLCAVPPFLDAIDTTVAEQYRPRRAQRSSDYNRRND